MNETLSTVERICSSLELPALDMSSGESRQLTIKEKPNNEINYFIEPKDVPYLQQSLSESRQVKE